MRDQRRDQGEIGAIDEYVGGDDQVEAGIGALMPVQRLGQIADFQPIIQILPARLFGLRLQPHATSVEPGLRRKARAGGGNTEKSAKRTPMGWTGCG